MPSFIASPCPMGRASALPLAAQRAHAPAGVAGVALAAALVLAGCASAPSATSTPAAKPVAAATPPTASPTKAATPPQASPDTDHTAGFAQWLTTFSAQALEAGQTPLNLTLALTAAQRQALLDDARGDSLDAVLCLLQAAWAQRRHAEGDARYGLPGDADPLEGWIVTA